MLGELSLYIKPQQMVTNMGKQKLKIPFVEYTIFLIQIANRSYIKEVSGRNAFFILRNLLMYAN